MLPGVQPKWLFYEAAELEAEQEADSSSTKIHVRRRWKDNATSLNVFDELVIEPFSLE